MSRWTRAMARPIEILIVLVAILGAPLSVSAHVNGVVGPYTILVVLIEEPYYTTNRAGFEFWVREGDRPVTGLDRTLSAQAISPTGHVDLQVSPLNDRGFYDVETGLDGKPFDPGKGGSSTLRLSGAIEGYPMDKSFAMTFPSYPRIALAQPTVTVSSSASFDGMLPIAIGTALATVLGLLVLGAWARRRSTREKLAGEEGFEPSIP
jgi:hypothetical protein